MAFRYLLFAFICALSTAQNTEVTPPSDPAGEPKSSCVTPGFMCSDCLNQAICIGNGEGKFTQIENKCPSGSHCVGNSCVVGAKCNYKPFDCTDDGFFPDPFDCKAYQVCVTRPGATVPDRMTMKCAVGSYDASTASCGFPLNSTACLEGPVPRCIEPLQIGMLTSDPSIYYICMDDGQTTSPSLYKCTGGKVFNVKETSCVSPKLKKIK